MTTSTTSPRIIIESHIPFIQGLLDNVANVEYLPPEAINAQAMASADALITRTRTRCDASLLSDSPCSMIATATIGTDHIDLDYCRRQGIEVANAPGCNAPAVAQYVVASLIQLFGADALEGQTIGVVGVGHVGEIVANWCRSLGMNVLECDPPKAATNPDKRYSSLEEIASKADIITFHTPLTADGQHPTLHIANAKFFNSLQHSPVIINSARGAVVDNAALVEALGKGQVSHAVIDCWENEPVINRNLLKAATIATPHIAGYSRPGKIRATAMALQAICRHFNLPMVQPAEAVQLTVPSEITASAVSQSYSPLSDTLALKSNPELFEKLRNTYHLRPEPF